MAENNDSFQYNYVAKQQEEIKKIRQKYLPKEDASLEHLRSLNQRASPNPAQFSPSRWAFSAHYCWGSA